VSKVLPVRQGLTADGFRSPRRVRLVVGGVDDGHTAHLQSIAEGKSGVVEILGDDSYVLHREAPLDEVVVADRRPELCKRHGKVRVLHLSGQGLLELLPEPTGSIDVPLMATAEERGEEGKPLDVIPVGVGDHQMPAHGRATAHQRLSEAVGSRAAVQHDERARSRAHLDARGVSAIAERARPRLGQRSSGAPESNLHSRP